jgi:hypothetical protein
MRKENFLQFGRREFSYEVQTQMGDELFSSLQEQFTTFSLTKNLLRGASSECIEKKALVLNFRLDS